MESIRSLDLQPDAILIAEDVLQQTYYLGTLDYCLHEFKSAHYFSIFRARVVDQYAATPLLGSATVIEPLRDRSQGADVYIIGSGENFANGERLFREYGITDVLESDRLEVVYNGHDGRSKTWKLMR